MTKILAIGDFHGKFPKKFEKIIKKEKIDAVISVGDYPPFHYRKLWFKHCFAKKDIEMWEIIGKKKYKELITKDYDMGEVVLKKLNKLPIPVFTVLGNIDYPKTDDVADSQRGKKKKSWNWADKEHTYFKKRLAEYKNIRRFDYSFAKFQGIVLIGMRGHSFTGRVKSKAFKKHRKIIDKLFKKFKKENKRGKLIFVSHTPPYNTKLDKISKKAHPLVAGKHHGSKLARRVINTHQPILNLCGHTHESFGKDKIKRTICVNTGAAVEGRAAIIILKEKKRPKVKFIK
ncbi:MAG: metallophosphoesterase [archaeon]